MFSIKVLLIKKLVYQWGHDISADGIFKQLRIKLFCACLLMLQANFPNILMQQTKKGQLINKIFNSFVLQVKTRTNLENLF